MENGVKNGRRTIGWLLDSFAFKCIILNDRRLKLLTLELGMFPPEADAAK